VNKAELIEALTARLGDRKTATTALDAVLAEVQAAVTKGDRVGITGFGVFEKRVRAARTARNPRTGESVKVKKTSIPVFRPGAGFKDMVASGKAPKVTAAKKTAAKSTTTRVPAARKTTAAKSTAATKAPAKRATGTAAKANGTAAKANGTAAKKTMAATSTGAAKSTAAKKTAPTRGGAAAAKAPAKKSVAKKTTRR